MGKDSESATSSTLQVLLKDPTSPEAWNLFVDRYGPRLLRWCRQWHLQPEDANDVMQEVLLKLVQHLRTYDPTKGRFRIWLKTVTRNAWRDILKGRQRTGWGSGDPEIQRRLENQPTEDSLVQALQEEFDRELLEQAKARVQLRVRHRTWEAFELVTVNGSSAAAAAAKLRMSVAAVYVAKDRVQKMLREEIQKLGGVDSEQSEDEQ